MQPNEEAATDHTARSIMENIHLVSRDNADENDT